MGLNLGLSGPATDLNGRRTDQRRKRASERRGLIERKVSSIGKLCSLVNLFLKISVVRHKNGVDSQVHPLRLTTAWQVP